MKNILISVLCLMLLSCSEGINIEPIDTSLKNATKPDYNFLSTPAYEVAFRNEDSRYEMPVQLYLRPFANVSDTTNFVMQYESDRYAQLVVLGDTLFPGDKKQIEYKQFIDYRLITVYSSQTSGTHRVKLSMTARAVTESADFQIDAR